MAKVAVVLSGSGYLDGSEITEAIATLVILSQHAIAYDCFAPDRAQRHVVDHLSGEPGEEGRNMLVESARIARGEIAALDTLVPEDYQAIIFPGGFGAAKNLCTFADDGLDARLHDDVKKALMPFVLAKKPVVAICAAPLLLALAAREAGYVKARITVGTGGNPLSEAIEAWGQYHFPLAVDQACLDSENRFISTPAYMFDDATPAQIFASVQVAIAALRELLG
ncbi:isoprenoid biosynthesis glyoxalase ElbB [Chitinimonas arctica]|uniref:Isoprenoid biosynthesis glyoxalase ElbB n=1 Tax=Chitinimonas arctica TaxID=2594795 RepID=A0A516SJ87_9NEIS|nr:isoprenoid biosynthesis glyoxalase ElbB [Chitinimonas arctica]QDQ28108.1 isoprenoid biosynthesis glyoxalase ElbB [Chitinimonas arctica]